MKLMFPLKAVLFLLMLMLSTGTSRAQQTKTLTGRIITEDLEPLPLVNIYALDQTLVGATNLEGYFTIHVAIGTDKLLFKSVGVEGTTVQLREDCRDLEVIIMTDGTYDFMSRRRVNRKRYRRFKALPKMHQQAYKRGIFKAPASCGTGLFTPY
jgi:hypothetical protein